MAAKFEQQRILGTAPNIHHNYNLLHIMLRWLSLTKPATNYYIHKVFTWFDLGPAFKLDMGIYVDNMTAVMLLMVSGCAFLIHIFSTYYMADDIRFGRFFVYMSLFTSAMLGLVVSDNLLGIFIFWEIIFIFSSCFISITNSTFSTF